MAPELKRNIQDTVFCDLFKIPKYQLALFNEIHPELPEVTEKDITFSNLTPVFLNQEYNDFSMVVLDKFMIFVEAQSGWSWNILPRILIYAAQKYKEYIDRMDYHLYRTSPIPLPRPEVYVVYTGDRKEIPERISFSEAFFGGESVSIEVRATVIHDPDGEGIISQYIFFTKVLQEARRHYGPTKQAIEETIRICQEQDKLSDYLESRKKEVVTIMEELFDFEKNMSRYVASEREQARAEGRDDRSREVYERLLAIDMPEDQARKIAFG